MYCYEHTNESYFIICGSFECISVSFQENYILLCEERGVLSKTENFKENYKAQ